MKYYLLMMNNSISRSIGIWHHDGGILFVIQRNVDEVLSCKKKFNVLKQKRLKRVIRSNFYIFPIIILRRKPGSSTTSLNMPYFQMDNY